MNNECLGGASQWWREGLWRPGLRIIFGARPLQTSDSSDTVGVARFVKCGKRACASPTLFLLLPANFLLVINSNFGRISYRFRDIDA